MYKKLITITILVIFIILFVNTIYDGHNISEEKDRHENIKIRNIETDKNTNVFVLILESTRADHLQCYGYERKTTPNICDISDDGILFENAYAQGTATFNSMPSFLSILPPNSASLPNWSYTLNNNLTTYIDILNKADFKTSGNRIQGILPTRQGLKSDHFSDDIKWNFYSGIELLNEILNQHLEKDMNKNFYQIFFNHRVHYPYSPSQEHRKFSDLNLTGEEIFEEWNDLKLDYIEYGEKGVQEIINLYDDELRLVDTKIGNFIEGLKDKEIYDDSLIIITSDHGQSFDKPDFALLDNYSRYIALHNIEPFEPVINVPLIVKLPENEYGNTTIDNNVRLNDVPPTIFDVLNLDIETIYGRSLIPTIHDDDDRTVVSKFGDYDMWTIISGDYKYFIKNIAETCLKGKQPTKELLFNIEKDPNEEVNLLSENETKYSEIAREMKNEICNIYKTGEKYRYYPVIEDMKPEVEESLKGLDYLQ